MSEIKLAVVGGGAVGRGALKWAQAAEDVSVAGVVEPSERSGRALREEFGVQVFADLGALLARTKPDCVKICSPNALHAEQTVACLEAGAHVLVEKPMATSFADCERMVAARDRAQKALIVNFEYRVSQVYLKVRQEIAAGRIGRVRNVLIFESRGPLMGREGSWRFKRSGAGGLIMEKGVHYIDLCHYFCESPFRRVTSFHGPNTLAHYEFPDNVMMIFKHIDGAQSVVGMYHGIQPDAFRGDYPRPLDPVHALMQHQWIARHGYMDYVMITGERGAIYANIHDYLVAVNLYEPNAERGGQSTQAAALHDLSCHDWASNCHDQIELLRNLVEVARGREKPRVTPEDVIPSMRAAFAAEESLADETPVEIGE